MRRKKLIKTTWMPFAAAAAVFGTLLIAAATAAPATRSASWWEALGWGLVGALAAVYRPLGPGALGLGALALPAMIVRLGAVSAALVAASAVALACLGTEIWRGRATAGALRPDSGWLRPAVERATFVAGAALLAGVAAERLGTAAAGLAVAGGVYLAVFFVLLLARRALDVAPDGFDVRSELGAAAGALGLDAAGWTAGALLVAAADGAGWGITAALAATIALVAAEAARLDARRAAAELRLADLERLQHAHERILAEISGLGGIAAQILTECRNILPVQWFQFEIPQADGESRSFAAGPDGVLVEGEPRPATRPPALPGVHRRAAWHVIEKGLTTEDEIRAVLRLWCDPRRVEPGAEELLTSLLPLMASSLHRAQLDREAKLDPLTGVPVRRMLDNRLQKAYRACCEEGRSMAVAVFDVDHFKRVNDTYGHAAGDAALVAFAGALDAHRRQADLLCRYGGEEFTLLCEATGGETALGLAERLRQAVGSLELVYEGQRIPLTVSAGVAAFPELYVKTSSELLLLADEALYEAKRQGRNRCLLNLGRGAYRLPVGRTLRSRKARRPERPPHFFG